MQTRSKYIFVIFITLMFSCKTEKAEGINVLNTSEFEEIIANPDVQLIDVRTVAEVEDGIIEDAENIVWDAEFASKLAALDKTKPVAVYCKRGGRSAKAAAVLSEQGFEVIYDLEGGYDAYNDNN